MNFAYLAAGSIFAAVMIQTPPAPPPPPQPPPEVAAGAEPEQEVSLDPELHAALDEVLASSPPHRRHVAALLERVLSSAPAGLDREALHRGATGIITHAGTSDAAVQEMYERLAQQHVVEEILARRTAAGGVQIDGYLKDWPRDAMLQFPRDKPGTELLKRFGMLRDANALYAAFEIESRAGSNPREAVCTIEIARLADLFTRPAYTLEVAGDRATITAEDGTSTPIDPGVLQVQHRGPIVEFRFETGGLEPSLRSAAVRGSVEWPRGRPRAMQTPWIACPTGPVSDPVAMLLRLAAHARLPKDSPLPLQVALQEGLLHACASEEVAGRIAADALAWYDFAVQVDALADRSAGSGRASPAAQLAWACRYDGSAILDSIAAYEFHVPSPQTIREMREFAQSKGWLQDNNALGAVAELRTLLGDQFKMHDYASEAARQLDSRHVDPDADAYYVKGDERLLSYRDVGINRRWSLFASGFGLKGSRAQAVQFERAFCLALGLPALRLTLAGPGDALQECVAVYDAGGRRWIAPGAQPPSGSGKDRWTVIWQKPWSRPERFPFWYNQPHREVDDAYRFVLEADSKSFTARSLAPTLNKGMEPQWIDRSLWPPLRGL